MQVCVRVCVYVCVCAQQNCCLLDIQLMTDIQVIMCEFEGRGGDGVVRG